MLCESYTDKLDKLLRSLCVCVICPVSVGTRMRSCFEKCGKTLELFPGELRKRLECFNI